VTDQLAPLAVKLFADGADRSAMIELYRQPAIKGFTTNPTLMRKAGIVDYRKFAIEILLAIPDRPISFEVFADDFSDMERQAMEMAAWSSNVFVKIPITNTRGETALKLVNKLSKSGVKLNITALMTLEQVVRTRDVLSDGTPAFVSVFAGRIADTGRDPIPMMAASVEALRLLPKAELIWASPREVLNVFQANAIGCHVITATPDILKKLSLAGKSLTDYSLETVKMFFDDGKAAGYSL
jgi:transaldolase